MLASYGVGLCFVTLLDCFVGKVLYTSEFETAVISWSWSLIGWIVCVVHHYSGETKEGLFAYSVTYSDRQKEFVITKRLWECRPG